MTMHFRALADRVLADGEISADEILGLRRDDWSDGSIVAEEADAMFEINDHLKYISPEWVDFFVEAITQFLVANGSPSGYVSEDQARWLIAHIERDQRLDSMAELELLAKLFDKAQSVPASLQSFALEQIEQAVLSGDGPTRYGLALEPGCINTEECRLLRRFIFSPAGERPAAASKRDAELLFRLKDATLSAGNAPEWQQLFVQGVGNYLQGFGGHEALSAERAAELERFMSNTAANVGGFLGRMASSTLDGGLTGLFGSGAGPLDDAADDAADLAAASTQAASEMSWLQDRFDADGQLDAFEQALLDFLAE